MKQSKSPKIKKYEYLKCDAAKRLDALIAQEPEEVRAKVEEYISDWATASETKIGVKSRSNDEDEWREYPYDCLPGLFKLTSFGYKDLMYTDAYDKEHREINWPTPKLAEFAEFLDGLTDEQREKVLDLAQKTKPVDFYKEYPAEDTPYMHLQSYRALYAFRQRHSVKSFGELKKINEFSPLHSYNGDQHRSSSVDWDGLVSVGIKEQIPLHWLFKLPDDSVFLATHAATEQIMDAVMTMSREPYPDGTKIQDLFIDNTMRVFA